MSMWRHPLLFIFFLHFRSFMFIWHHPSYSLDFLHFLPFIWFSSFHFQVILFHVAPSSIHLIFFISGHSYSSGAIPSYSLDFLHFRSFMIIWRHPLLFIRFSSFQVIHVHLAPSPPIHWIFFISGHVPLVSFPPIHLIFFISFSGHSCPSGAISPLPCADGFYADVSGSDKCLLCDAGFSCLNKSSTPVKCSQGHYSEEVCGNCML